ncbi:PIN domain-containing protein [Nocardia sp. R6R-6]|uniref:PIN domain-containing protein n=1 Tax=Nocardia sp. R6R-6 TaxID=3459303 RepID=UPI00403DD630
MEPVHPGDWLRMAELVARYWHWPVGTADASVVATAERLDITRIATVGRRLFAAIRPGHTAAFELLPQ